jgi:hypothetical protein
MAQAAFTQTLTAQQIVHQADDDAGSPGKYLDPLTSGETLGAPAYVRLQSLLDHEAQSGDYPFRNDRLTISVSSRMTVLPSDFWRATFPEAWIYDSGGNRVSLRIMGEGEFHARLSDASKGTGQPMACTVMLNHGAAQGGTGQGVLLVEPSPDRAYQVELPYQPLSLPLGTILSIPWFPYSLWLIKALAVELFINQDDTRMIAVGAERDRLKREIQRTQHGPGMRNAQLGMHPNVFRTPLRF